MFALVVLAFGGYASSAIVKPPVFPIISRGELKAAHRYHGINYSFQEAAGGWCFIRDGQTCQLFSYLKERR